jgi:hypothetical protein
MPELPASKPVAAPTPPPVVQPKPTPPPMTQPKPQEAEVQGQGAEEPEPTPKAPNLPPELISPPPPANVAESLAQRLTRYQAEERLAKESGNSSKARRMGRICKQYQDAIKLNKAGKPIPVDELPTPPGESLLSNIFVITFKLYSGLTFPHDVIIILFLEKGKGSGS